MPQDEFIVPLGVRGRVCLKLGCKRAYCKNYANSFGFGVRGGKRQGRFNLVLAVPRAGLLQRSNNGFGFLPIGGAGSSAVELPAERAGQVDQARAFFPASPSLFKLAGAGVFGVGVFTFLAVASIEVEGNATFEARCTPLHAGTTRYS